MSEHRRETAFLKRIIAFDGSAAGRELERRLVQAETNERCIQRAALLAGGVAVLCAAGLGYGMVLQEDFFFGEPQLVVDLLCAVGMALFVSLLVFVVLLLWHRKQLCGVREECRQLMTRFLDTRLPSGATQSPSKAVETGRGITEPFQIVPCSQPPQTNL